MDMPDVGEGTKMAFILPRSRSKACWGFWDHERYGAFTICRQSALIVEMHGGRFLVWLCILHWTRKRLHKRHGCCMAYELAVERL